MFSNQLLLVKLPLLCSVVSDAVAVASSATGDYAASETTGE